VTRSTVVLASVVLAAACASSAPPAAPAPPSRDAANATGGTGGSLPPAGTGGAIGSTLDSAAGTGGAPPDAAPPAPDLAVIDAPVADGRSPTSDGSFPGIIPDGAPWQRQCPPGASRSDCCVLYCACMTAYCPATIPQNCQSACENGANWDLVCRNYQCFATQNPSFPQDHDSHCRHAIGLQGRCGNK
jgi:hypothetical protein